MALNPFLMHSSERYRYVDFVADGFEVSKERKKGTYFLQDYQLKMTKKGIGNGKSVLPSDDQKKAL